MRFTALYPLHHTAYSDEILDPSYVTGFARAAEDAGFDAVAATEHPAPTAKWRRAGGHDALDVFTLLGFFAAVTSRVALMPYVAVPAFRSPVMGAKQVATLDVLSAGRVIMPVGTGYLRAEGTAMGMSFDERNELLDEALEVWRAVWAGEEVSLSGRNFEAPGILVQPRPVQQPHPPIWIGGNSARARQRVADQGQGWSPILANEVLARTTRTAPLPDLPTLKTAIDDLHRRLERADRDPATVTVQLQGGGGRVIERDEPFGPYLDWLDEVEATGVTQLIVEVPADSSSRSLDRIARYGSEVIAHRR